MAFNRKDWPLTFVRDDNPKWPCPNCNRTALTHDEHSLNIVETAESKSAHSHEAFEVEWIAERFTCMYQCGSCHEPVTVVGTVTIKEFRTDGMDGFDSIYEKSIHPLFVYPPVRFFEVPESCPSSARKEIKTAFLLFWCSPSSASTHIRHSLEALMDGLKIKRFETTKGRRRRLWLHERLDLFCVGREHLGRSLLALKWIGNEGTHNKITHEDIFDAFEILDHVLDELFVKRAKRVAKLASAINKSKRPRSVAEQRRLARQPPPF
jgi:hypothetical protein